MCAGHGVPCPYETVGRCVVLVVASRWRRTGRSGATPLQHHLARTIEANGAHDAGY